MRLTSEERTERRTYSASLQRKKEEPNLITVWILFLRKNKNKFLNLNLGKFRNFPPAPGKSRNASTIRTSFQKISFFHLFSLAALLKDHFGQVQTNSWALKYFVKFKQPEIHKSRLVDLTNIFSLNLSSPVIAKLELDCGRRRGKHKTDCLLP